MENFHAGPGQPFRKREGNLMHTRRRRTGCQSRGKNFSLSISQVRNRIHPGIARATVDGHLFVFRCIGKNDFLERDLFQRNFGQLVRFADTNNRWGRFRTLPVGDRQKHRSG